MKFLLKSSILLLAIFSFQLAEAQPYKHAIGLRGGLANGITYKQFISNSSAFEGIATIRWGGYNLTALYQKHFFNDIGVENLDWYIGAGGHIGFWEGNPANPWFSDNDNHMTIGADGIIGLQFTFDEVPLNISADWKPAINLIGDQGFWGDEAAISIRYTF